jgi:membrane protease YdiL (CAAX protease family)
MKIRLLPSQAALVEIGLMFLPAIPAYLWLWPSVSGTVWPKPVQSAVYVYFLAGTLLIGLRRWNLDQLGLNRKGIGLSLACGLAFVVGQILVVVATDLPWRLQPMTLKQIVCNVTYYFGLVGLIEELLFRGLMYRALDEWRGARLAIWGSALVFGLYHVGGQGLAGGLGTFIAGVVFGAIRWRAGGIAGLIVAHGLSDVTTLWMLPGFSIQLLSRPQIVHPVLLILGYGLILGVPVYLWKAPTRK